MNKILEWINSEILANYATLVAYKISELFQVTFITVYTHYHSENIKYFSCIHSWIENINFLHQKHFQTPNRMACNISFKWIQSNYYLIKNMLENLRFVRELHTAISSQNIRSNTKLSAGEPHLSV